MNSRLFGAALILISHGFNSFNKVWYAQASAYVDPMIYAFIGYGIAIAFFWICDCRGASKPLSNQKDWWNINLSSALTFVCFLYALKYIDAVIVSSIESGLLVIFTLLLGRREKPLTLKVMVYAVCIFSFTLASCYFGEGVRELNVLGLVLAVLTSLGVAYIIRHQKVLIDLGYESNTIMKHRFYLIAIVSFGYVWIDEGQLPIKAIYNVVSVELLVVAFLGSVLCLYLIQKGIALCNIYTSSALMASMPVVTFVVSYAYGNGDVNVNQLITVLLLAMSLMLFSRRAQDRSKTRLSQYKKI
ncbi:DMT family transporter [Aliivibrio fischeri]|uniref:DMT family transporter n=1 Tax=Aliivibrio fischeri TaxID=668 RepID=UPI0012DA695B|nr:DMT family transporter [Aliivibrio fischeri]MUJ37777.1 hypothetical protein [Aliivibrio fischeri]